VTVEFRKDLFANERDDNLNEIGKPSPHHHARIRSLDASVAERMPGVVRVVRPSDVPNNLNTLLSLIGFGRDDEQLLSDAVVRYIGEPVLAIVATSEAIAREACAAVRLPTQTTRSNMDLMTT